MLAETFLAFGLLVAALAAMNVIFNMATAVLATCLGIPIDQISTGVGPALLRLPLGRVELSFGLIPVAGSVRFSDAETRPDLESSRFFVNASWLKKVLIGLGGPLSVILAAVPILGFSAFYEALEVPRWLLQAVLDIAEPLDFNALIWPMIGSSGWLAAGAIIAVKAAGLNLLPIPVLNGGSVLIWTVEAIAGRKLPSNVLEWLYRLGLVLLITTLVIILYRLVQGVV